MTTIIDVYTGGKRVAQIVENSRCGNELVLSQLQHVLDSNVHIVPLKGDVFSQASSLPIETMEATIAAEYDFESSYENWLPNFEDWSEVGNLGSCLLHYSTYATQGKRTRDGESII